MMKTKMKIVKKNNLKDFIKDTQNKLKNKDKNN